MKRYVLTPVGDLSHAGGDWWHAPQGFKSSPFNVQFCEVFVKNAKVLEGDKKKKFHPCGRPAVYAMHTERGWYQPLCKSHYKKATY